ncbi:DUF5839 family protein [Agrilactobacillus yilanensis]|uniref:DUF5839 family protein n=1 Tax=Agrilactobacillus yilanensis TaxID=2485997 RepID=A0ABW4J6J1_9LACO|nr:DUF5839 family protein [Agrilactobacillus yilanensis]
MADNVLMGLHIRKDSPDGEWYLKTDKVYKWRITSKTTGQPKPGNLAIVQTKFGTRNVLVYATKEVKNNVADLKPVVKFQDHSSKNAKIVKTFEAFYNKK